MMTAEEKKAHRTKYLKENGERIVARNAEYRKKNKEHIAARSAIYRAENKERIAAYQSEHREMYRERKNERQHRWREKNQARFKVERKHLRSQFFEKYGRICACCGETDERCLTIDHVRNNGGEERKKMSGPAILKKAINNVDFTQYQILCWNCQIRKLYNGGVCPKVKT